MENTSGKILFKIEDEIKASPKTLLPYLSTAVGLSHWFADKVTEIPSGDFVFVWDNQPYQAKKSFLKETNSIRFTFIKDDDTEARYVEFKTEANDMTSTTFLSIIDYSEIDDVEDYRELYDYCIKSLKEKVGGKINS